VVVDPGTEPRQRVQYELSVHTAQRMDVTTKQAIEMAINSPERRARARGELPIVHAIGKFEVAEIAPDGAAIVSYDAEEAKAEPTSNPQLRRLTEQMVEADRTWHSRWRVLPSGYIVKGVAGAAKNGGPMQLALDDSVHQFGVVFPDVPIGVGASWRSESTQTLGGVTWHRTVTYHLAKLEGTTANVVEDGALRADAQTLDVEPNVTARLTSGTGTVSAHLTVSLHEPVPTGAQTILFELNLTLIGRRSHAASTMSGEIEVTSSRADNQ
jgi:hypothetical protein